ncbi:MAG: adenylosuccinate lyase [Sulfurospirillaceae bacterium]|nr:adenylosuccinate lyase [Sulfurospirillaceae bacterium]MDD2827394.1 adenylosuccinate lyase [Sulfurospirillaceae bacterium]
MQISLSHDMLAITLQEDAKTFYFLQNLAEKNFQKKIGRKTKTIIFKEEAELVQRRYFLKLVSKIYQKKTNDIAVCNKIENALDKTIKISLLKSNQLLQHIDIKMNIEDNYAVVFSIGTHHTLLASYLKNYFKDHLIRFRPKYQTITLYPNSEQTVCLIEKLLLQKELLGCFVHFDYNKQNFIDYKKALNSKKSKRNHHHALFSLLEDYFRVLECKMEDSFETVRGNYLKLVKKYHPDSCGLSHGDLHVMYLKKFQEIQYAYEMIKMHYKNESALRIA